MKSIDHEIRVRYAETDQMKVSYYANYFIWFEAARAELFRNLELPYTEFEEKNIFLPVVDAYCKYFAPSVYDQLLYVRTSVCQLKVSSMKFHYQILNEEKEKVLAWGFTTHVFINPHRKPVKIPSVIKDKVTLFELKEKEINM